TVTLSEPAVATVLAVVIVGERLTPIGWTGVAVISAVLVILALAPTNAPAPASAMAPVPASSTARTPMSATASARTAAHAPTRTPARGARNDVPWRHDTENSFSGHRIHGDEQIIRN
ncbi:MAG: hypothetical protein MOP51_212, partial [Citricoccus sp.]|nr:hypothetical protein [Citricoccus sp. WCRC_4]